MLLRGPVIALASLIALAGCQADAGGEPSASSAPSPSSPSSASAEPSTSSVPPTPAPEPEQDPAMAFRSAVRAVADEPVTGFDSTLRFAGQPFWHVSGLVQASGWTAGVVFTPPGDDPVPMDVRSDGSTVWMQLRDWPEPMSGCWLDLGLESAPVGLLALTGPEPAYLSVLSRARATGYAGTSTTEVLVEVPLADAVRLLTGQVLERLGRDAVDAISAAGPGDAPVTVRARVADRLESLEVAGSAFLDALAVAGVEVDDTTRAALESLTATITYAEPPVSAAPVETPAPASVVAQGDEATGC